jgi:hypothetical protein
MPSKSRSVPLNKRYPNQWSTRTVFYTPQGSRVDIEGPLPKEAGQLALHLMCANVTPKLARKLQAFYEELVEITNGKKPTPATLVTPTS